MSEQSKFSLWVTPKKDSDLYIKLQGLIADLGRRFQAPIFETHITLLGDIQATSEDIITQVNELATKISPYKVTLDFIDYTDNLYQSLVIRILASKEVIDANKKARDMFNRHEGTLYVPHISIIYKTAMDNETKKSLIKEIGDQFKGAEFLVDSIVISEQTESGRIEDWKIAGEVKLNG